MRGTLKLLVRPPAAGKAGITETYDLVRDPAESVRLEGEPGALMAALRGRETTLAERAAMEAQKQPPSEATQQKLHALGYVN